VRILIVEDEQPLADAVARGLRREGMAVDIAYDGDSGQEKAAVTRYDVVVLDRDLPGMSGDRLCVEITGSGSVTRVLMLTASAGDVLLDPSRRTASRSGAPVDLTRKEFGVLEVLLAAGGGVVSSEELLERVWDENADPFTTTVRVTVMTLRKMLGEPGIIETVVGSGYRVPSADLASG
jgi:DNA-binding response OmpR family regulator